MERSTKTIAGRTLSTRSIQPEALPACGTIRATGYAADYAVGALSAMQAHMATATRDPSADIGTPEEIADVAVFLCSSLASGVNGQNIIIDHGLREAKHPMAGIWKAPTIEPL
jgi:enoyl-[acyl-carrier-protein] reductase (NADH)